MIAVNDRVIIEVEESAGSSAGGLIIPEAFRGRDFIGKVMAFGASAHRMKLEGVKVGDRVLYNKYSELVKIEGVEYRVCKDEHVLAVLPKKKKTNINQRGHEAQTSKEWANLDE